MDGCGVEGGGEGCSNGVRSRQHSDHLLDHDRSQPESKVSRYCRDISLASQRTHYFHELGIAMRAP